MKRERGKNEVSKGSYGKRPDGTEKGRGWLGELKLPNGGVATEYSVGVNLDGKETLIPTLVPTLTKEQVATMVNDVIPNRKDVPEDILRSAALHAKERIAKGESVWAPTNAIKEVRQDVDGGNSANGSWMFDKAGNYDPFKHLSGVAKSAKDAGLKGSDFSTFMRDTIIGKNDLLKKAEESAFIIDHGRDAADARDVRIRERAETSADSYANAVREADVFTDINRMKKSGGTGKRFTYESLTKKDKAYMLGTRQDAMGGDGGEGGENPPEPSPQAQSQIGPRIAVNPEVFNDKRDALCVAFNEAYRVVMEMNGFDPVAEPTDKQREFFSDTAYADDETMLRRTILARICTFDTSVGDPTDEQLQEAVEFLSTVMEIGAPQNRWEQSVVQRTKDILEKSIGMPREEKEPQNPAPTDAGTGTQAAAGGGEAEEEDEKKSEEPTNAVEQKGQDVQRKEEEPKAKESASENPSQQEAKPDEKKDERPKPAADKEGSNTEPKTEEKSEKANEQAPAKKKIEGPVDGSAKPAATGPDKPMDKFEEAHKRFLERRAGFIEKNPNAVSKQEREETAKELAKLNGAGQDGQQPAQQDAQVAQAAPLNEFEAAHKRFLERRAGFIEKNPNAVSKQEREETAKELAKLNGAGQDGQQPAQQPAQPMVANAAVQNNANDKYASYRNKDGKIEIEGKKISDSKMALFERRAEKAGLTVMQYLDTRSYGTQV